MLMKKKESEITTKFDDETLNHLRNVELMIFNDFIKICDENNLEYYSYGGTALGAIRHRGFIPWDDDIDVLLFREDYEKFLEIAKKEYHDKYDFLCIENYEDYLVLCCKMSLKGTRRLDNWDANATFNVGIHIDIFALDYAPSNKIKWFIYYQKCQLLMKFEFFLTGFRIGGYTTSTRRTIGNMLKNILNLIHINNNLYIKLYKKFIAKTNPKDNLVYDMNARCYDKPFPTEIFKPAKKVKFESIEINVPNDVDKFLKITFGEDYMKLPPEEKRVTHYCEIDFGKY